MGERRAKTVQKRVRLPVAISSQTRLGNPRKARRFVGMFGQKKPSFDCKEYKVNVKSNLINKLLEKMRKNSYPLYSV